MVSSTERILSTIYEYIGWETLGILRGLLFSKFFHSLRSEVRYKYGIKKTEVQKNFVH
jgi:hypothetical protein